MTAYRSFILPTLVIGLWLAAAAATLAALEQMASATAAPAKTSRRAGTLVSGLVERTPRQ